MAAVGYSIFLSVSRLSWSLDISANPGSKLTAEEPNRPVTMEDGEQVIKKLPSLQTPDPDGVKG